MYDTDISKIPNPFRFGEMVDAGEFCNRKEEIRTIKQYVFDRYSFWLFSPRRYGKSSLIKRAFAEIKDAKTIYIDLYNVKTLDDFVKKYSKILAGELFDWRDEVKSLSKKIGKYLSDLRPQITINSDGVPSLSLEKAEINEKSDIEEVLNMPEKFAADHKLRICIAFDEFQEIERIDPFIINWMRTSFQHHKNVCYAFLGSKQTLMENIFANINSPFYEFAVKMVLGPVGEADFRRYIKRKFKSSGMAISDGRIDKIMEKSGGHPHFTQYFASIVFDMMRNGEEYDDEETFAFQWMNKIILSQGIVFQGIYDQLSTKQRTVISAIALAGDDAELFSDKTRKDYNMPVSSTLAITLSSLMKKNLIYKTKKRYRIDNPVFKEWLIRLNKGLLT